MPNWTSLPLAPSHLGVFVSNRATGGPIARLPVYAEAVWTERTPPPPPDARLSEPMIATLMADDPRCAGEDACRVSMVAAFAAAMSVVLTPRERSALTRDGDRARHLFHEALRHLLDAEQVDSLEDVPSERLGPAARDALAAAAAMLQLELRVEPEALKVATTFPLGVLATDHIGYLSFDLRRLPAAVRASVLEALEALREDPDATAPAALWVYPFAPGLLRYDALRQRRFADDAIVMRLDLHPFVLPPHVQHLGLPALQNPSLTDWRLSPGSFAAQAGALLGEDGCEHLFPANLAQHGFNFHQVIGLTDPAAKPNLPAAAAPRVKVGFVNEFRLTWYPIGHSLGQILHSFPLAPGESVNLAIVDWSRQDAAQRTEETKLDESLFHTLRRDRVITETVDAAIDEWQRGGSLMGGTAASAGGAAGIGGMGLAAGVSSALGGAYSTSSGSRDIAASTMQKVADNVVQSSTASRELRSTVVVQTRQTEKESIETRTIVNYNHSHALTILYYEVLRHFRIVMEFVRRRPVVLTNIHGGITFQYHDGGGGPLKTAIYWPAILENRKVIQDALLDTRYAGHLDMVERREHRQRVAEVVGPPPPPPPPIGPWFRYFNFDLKTGGLWADEKGEHVGISVSVWPKNQKLNDGNAFSLPGAFTEKDRNNPFTGLLPTGVASIPWSDIDAFELRVFIEEGGESDTAVSFSKIKITGIDTNGGETVLVDRDYVDGHVVLHNNANVWLPTKRPAPPAPPPPRPAAEIEEEAAIRTFEAHLLHHRAHYERAVRLGSTPAQRAAELAALDVGGSSLLEKVENRPLEVLGDFVAYPLVDPAWADKIEDAMAHADTPEPPAEERLATLPTRGVFAEAKLGHCNASEEIDNTRFWDWQASPIPHMAPEIAPVQAVTPQPQQVQGLQTSSFPNSLLNIVNPPAAPDPTGLGAALTALTTANIFRDMSGRAELADLLKKLSDNSVAIAKVAQQAIQAPASGGGNQQGAGQQGANQQGSGQQGSGQQGAATGGGGDGSTAPKPPSMPEPTPPKPIQTDEQKQEAQISNTDKKLDVAKKHLPPAQQKEVRKQAVKELNKPDKVNKKFEISVYGYGNQSVVGKWTAELRQRNTIVGSLTETEVNQAGRVVINAGNEFDDNRYALDFSGEVLAGFGVNARLRGYGMSFTIPPEIFSARDYYYVKLHAPTDHFVVKVKNGQEIMNETTAKFGSAGGAEARGVTFTLEGGGEWKWGDTRTFEREIEVKVSYYLGGFDPPTVS